MAPPADARIDGRDKLRAMGATEAEGCGLRPVKCAVTRPVQTPALPPSVPASWCSAGFP
jgi:hypothetical protein